MKHKGTNMENMVEIFAKIRLLTQRNTSYKGGRILEAIKRLNSTSTSKKE